MSNTDSLMKHAYAGALASGLAEYFTFPVDFVKTRLHMNTYGSLSNWVKTTYQQGGMEGFFAGVTPATARTMIYCGVTMEIYSFLNKYKTDSYSFKYITGGVAGFVGSFITTPLVLAKIRLINEFETTNGVRGLLMDTVREEGGISALFKGGGPNIYRAVLACSIELGTYDLCKNFTNSYVASSIIATCLSSLLTCPLDVVRTRYMTQFSNSQYSNPWRWMVDVARKEGVSSLFNGLVPYTIRKSAWGVIFYPTYELLKSY